MKEEPIKLLALITSNYRLYYQCKILAQKGYSGQQIAKTINVHPYRVKLALNQVRQYELGQLLNIINNCAETDYKLKSSYMDKHLILELFILSLLNINQIQIFKIKSVINTLLYYMGICLTIKESGT